MSKDIIEYSFSSTNKKTLIFIPGYSGGLNVSTIKKLVDYFVSQSLYNVYGVTLDYEHDTLDVFDSSQEKLIQSVKEIVTKTSGTEIILLAKSLGGSLAVVNYRKLPVNKLVILGCSVVLGWPQRISLLESRNPVIPNYKTEWNEVFSGVTTPILIISGSADDLTDNVYLSQVSDSNNHVKLVVLENADHNLEDLETGQQKALTLKEEILA